MTTPTEPTPRTAAPKPVLRRSTRRTLAPLFQSDALPLFHAYRA